MFTSSELILGTIYTRAQLRELFAIGNNSNLNNGVFRPKGTSSIWLFVTERKTEDRTQYRDKLDGNVLYWQGQTFGRTDKYVINHAAANDELLLFYRTSKTEHPGAGFRYEGQFCYVSHEGERPTSFVLRRVEPQESLNRHEGKRHEVPATELEPFEPFGPWMPGSL